jgi:ankyrin repeat protein
MNPGRAEFLQRLCHLAVDAPIPKSALSLRDHAANGILHWAVATFDGELVKNIAAAGADINAKNQVGRTPLMVAAYLYHQPLVELLLKCGADRNIKDSTGQTAQGHAQASGLASDHQLQNLLAPSAAGGNVTPLRPRR